MMADTTDTKRAAAARLGRRVRRLRKAAGLSVAELAKVVGLTRQAVDQIERGQVNARRHTLVGLAGALGVLPERLIGP